MPTRALYVIINVAIQMLNPNFGLFFYSIQKVIWSFRREAPLKCYGATPTALTDVITYRFCKLENEETKWATKKSNRMFLLKGFIEKIQ